MQALLTDSFILPGRNRFWKRHRYLIGMALIVAVGCGDVPPTSDRFDRLFSGNAKVIDLTHNLSFDMPYWPSSRGNPFRHDTLAAHPDGSPIMAAYFTPEHHGTHIDAPVHGGEGLRSVDALTAADLFGPAVVIDVSEQAAANADYRATLEDLQAWESAHGILPTGAIVLLSTGWSRKWDSLAAYQNLDELGRPHFPGFSEEAATWLVAERDIRGIGIDDLSVDYGASSDFAVHGIVNGAGKFHLENVANVHLLPASGAFLIVAPIKIEGGSGGQVRLFAVIP